ncbi:MAG: 50S ribosomal protein P1 [Promethearchaeia archaeon]
MESIYAALLLHKVGGEINESNIEKILKAAGADIDKNQIAKLIAGLKDTDIDSLIASAAAAPVVAATAPATSEAAPVEEPKKEPEPEEEEDDEPTGIGSLF